ncbi:MAG TPA: hypothetical protein VEI07_02860, partial [Planctomycetaceae bacterium]|nr:hypothetical protein [Planctomycetaceae bacterium]
VVVYCISPVVFDFGHTRDDSMRDRLLANYGPEVPGLFPWTQSILYFIQRGSVTALGAPWAWIAGRREDVREVLSRFGSELVRLPVTLAHYPLQGPVAAIVVAGALLVLLLKSDGIGSLLDRLGRRLGQRTGWLLAILAVECVFVAGMFFVDWALQQAPPPVLYMAF